MIGATIAVVGMPASLKSLIASRRFAGVAARGSITRADLPVERRDRQRHACKPALRHSREDIDIAHDERRLRHDADGMRGLLQHLEDRAHDETLALDRLIGVGVRPDRDDLGLVGRIGQLALEQRRGIRLCVELGLEVESCRMSQITVRRPREAVDAAVLASPVGIDRAVERDVGAIVARDDRTRRLFVHLRLERIEIA